MILNKTQQEKLSNYIDYQLLTDLNLFEELVDKNNKQLLFTYERVEKIRHINGLEIK